MLSHIDICRMNRLMEHNPEAKKIIEQLLQNHQTIVSLISHEIRNPLTLISSSLQLMEQTHPEVRDFSNWDQTMQDLDFLCQLLSELSAYNNGSTLRYQVFSLQELLRSVAVSFAISLENASVSFRSSIDPAIKDYAGDQIKLREVLLNLLKNARESQADEIVLSASSGCDTSGIQISIRDNGCGIEQNQLDQIFQAFHTTKQEGTGLGLSLSKRIIEAHHGTLTVTSAPGEGSTFTVFLPL
ncbi:sensor histidine kinase [Ruminococcus sp. AF14-10]|nr:sensor histidine kinase [Ruminococcus sp. AF14-10]